MTDPAGPVDPILIAKRALRAQLRERRRTLYDALRTRHDRVINREVVQLARDVPPGAVAGFRAFDGEPDLTPALAELARSGRPLVLPVLAEQPVGITLQFRAWDPGEQLSINCFGIAEPGRGAQVPLEAIALMLVPLVGWDEQGGRLGMGAGYYDRAFAGAAGSTRPLRAGIAYSLQRVDAVPTDAHDIPLHVVITENGRFTCPA